MKLLRATLLVLVAASMAPLPVRAETSMTTAAQKFIDALSPEQRGKALFGLKNDERLNWHFVPKARAGLALKDMTDEQRTLAHALLKTALSGSGYSKVTNIISLETILFELENRSPTRDTGLYYVSIFGAPKDRDWAWRFEGHHLSLNFFVRNHQLLSMTPAFLGANPAEIPAGPRKGLRILAGEEDLARKLVKSFSDAQKKIGIIADVAPRDIITGSSRKAKFLEPAGIPSSKLTKEQRQTLTGLLEEYILRYRAEIAEPERKRILKSLDKIFFAWAGGAERGEGHYYRIQGPTFLIEYDNTQNKANHVHCVWRDLEKDFGDDVLAEHHRQSHP